MRVFAVFLRLFRQFLRDGRTLALIFIVPIAVMCLFYLLLKDGFSPGLSLGLAGDGLAGAPMAQIQAELESTGGIKISQCPEATGANASDVLAERGLDALCIFPPGFWDRVRQGRAADYALAIEGGRSGVEDGISKAISAALLSKALQDNPAIASLWAKRSVKASVSYVHDTRDLRPIDFQAPAFIAFFVFFVSFLLTSVSFLRERASGTLERVLISPAARVELIGGYLLAFFVLGALQGGFLLAFSSMALGIRVNGGLWATMPPLMANALIGVCMGIFFSGLAKNEFQVIQFIPLVVIPQVLLCGILIDIQALPGILRPLSACLPLSYSARMLKSAALGAMPYQGFGLDLLALGGFTLLFFGLSALSLGRNGKA